MQISSYISSELYSTDKLFFTADPFTGEKRHTVSSCDLMGLVRAINSGNKAAAEFKSSTSVERQQIVEAIKSYIHQNKKQISEREAIDQALPLAAANNYIIDHSIKVIDSYLEEVRSVESQNSSPVGLIAVISTWNFSLRQVISKIVPAILAGNAVLIKISGQTPSTALTLTEMIIALKLPVGLLQVLVSDDPEVKTMLVSHPGIRAVSFIGTLENGVRILNQAVTSQTQNFKKIHLSLGTKNSAVCIDEPSELNFKEIMQSFMLGQGQLAYNSARLFILEKYETAWVDRIQSYLEELRPSESIHDSSLWTPVLKRQYVDNFAGIKKQAFEDQAKLIESQKYLNGLGERYLPPVFTRDMSRCSTLQQDQIHCPFFILSTVKYPFDIAKYSNVSYFGFAAHLWGAPEKLTKIAENLDVGQIDFNSWSASRIRGAAAVKQSTFGIQDDRVYGWFYSNPKIF